MTSWIVDVGAFDGLVGKKLKQQYSLPVLYLEPDADAFRKIELSDGDLKLNLAAAPHDGTIDFYRYQPGTHSVLEIDFEKLAHYIDGNTGQPAHFESWSTSQAIKVPCRRLDSLCRELHIDQIKFLKIDAQGYDLEVLKSLGDEIRRVEELVCEVQKEESRIYKNSATQKEILDYLHAKGFLFIRQQVQSYGQELNMFFKRNDLLGGLKKEPLVSILTPSFNGARFLEQCIKSVLAQDYPYVEHIIQDGVSQDGSLEVLKKYSEKVHWVSEADKGQSDGLNKALQRCQGEIIGVLNADDEYLPGAVSWAVEQLMQFPDIAGVYAQQYNIDETGTIISETKGPDPYHFDRIFCCDDVIPAQTAFIRRSSLEAVGFYIDATRPTCPDYELWVRLGLKFPMKYAPGFIARYRWHKGSEGQNLEDIEKMVASKREVIDRICDDPNTPEFLKKLRQRAHGGVLRWSTGHWRMMDIPRKHRKIVSRLWKSFLIHPSWRAFRSLLLSFPFPKDDYRESGRVLVRRVREIGRTFDKWVLFGAVYKYIYLPIKRAIKSNVKYE